MQHVARSSPLPSRSSRAQAELERLITRCCRRARRALVSAQIKPPASSEQGGCLQIIPQMFLLLQLQ